MTKCIIFFLGVMAAVGSLTTVSRAAELPSLDITAICKSNPASFDAADIVARAKTDEERATLPAVIKQLEDGCIKAQQDVKGQAARLTWDDRLVAYCTADADFHGNGYLGLMMCRVRVEHDQQMQRLDKALGGPIAAASNYCDLKYQRADGGAWYGCLSRQYEADIFLQISGEIDDAVFDGCIAQAVDAGKSYEVMSHCLNSLKSASTR